ncbi:MAG: hypothetical protein KatS3mg038_0929 [Candidatus Kapaibacterium sp.]|nr:MAG: hypothetical protein KatS3mg038_0929 [Candidatus Kapabacteria bacterium]
MEGSPNWYGSGLENRRAMSLWGFESPTLRTNQAYPNVGVLKLFHHHVGDCVMRYLRFAMAIAIPLAGLWLASCKSGTTSPEQPAALMPLAEGNYWVYDEYELDSNYQRTGNKAYDSLYVGASIQLAGRTAYPVFSYHRGDSVYQDTLYYSVDANGTLWQYMSLSGDFEGAELPTIPPRWVKITTGGNETSWTVFDSTLSITFQGMPFSLTMKVTGAKAGTESITLNGKTYTAQRFSQKIEANVAGGFASFMGADTSAYIAGIGRAKSRSSTTLSIPIAGTTTRGGIEAILVRYRVAAQ